MTDEKIKVLVVDDSAVVRHILEKGINQHPDLIVVGTAVDPFDARDKILSLRPDVVTLDIEMPKMTGVDFLAQLLPQYPIPVIMVSSLTKRGSNITMKSLEIGAVDFISKPKGDVQGGLASVMEELCEKIKIAAVIDIEKLMLSRKRESKVITKTSILDKTKIIAMGVSTGGLETMKYILSNLPHNMPGIVLTQHMPAGYTKSYAETLNDFTDLYVVEAKNGDKILPGKVLVAQGGLQMTVAGSPGNYYVNCLKGEKVNGHCPSVDALFNSVATHVGRNAIGVILTGMGKDGAEGLLKMKNKGSFTIAQSESTCIVFGMPRVAIDIGAQSDIRDLEQIPTALMKKLSIS